MHTLTNWKAVRSGPRLTIHGFDEAGQLVKLPAAEVRGPSKGRVCRPDLTLAFQPDGTPIALT